MREPSSLSILQKTTRPSKRVRSTSPKPRRFATLAFVVAVSVAAGTALGATMYRFELRAPLVAATENQSVKPAGANDAVAQATDNRKSVVAIKSRAVNPLPRNRTAMAALPADSGRFGSPDQIQLVAEKKPLINQLREQAGVDGEKTGSILSQPPPAEIAETEAEIIELEQKLTSEGAEHFKVPAQSASDSALQPTAEGMYRRQTAKYVNLRAGPDNEADVLAIVPARTELLAQDDCIHWCAAIYLGQKGYIYKTFFRQIAQNTGG